MQGRVKGNMYTVIPTEDSALLTLKSVSYVSLILNSLDKIMLTATGTSRSRCLQLVLVHLLFYGLTFSTVTEVGPVELTSDNVIITGHRGSNNNEPNILQLLDDLGEAPLLLKLIDKVGLRDLLSSKGKVRNES